MVTTLLRFPSKCPSEHDPLSKIPSSHVTDWYSAKPTWLILFKIQSKFSTIDKDTHGHLFGSRVAKLAVTPARVAEAVADALAEEVALRLLESSGARNGVGENAQSHGGNDEEGGLELHLERIEVE